MIVSLTKNRGSTMALHKWKKDKEKFSSFDAQKYTCENCNEKINLNGCAEGVFPSVHYEECVEIDDFKNSKRQAND